MREGMPEQIPGHMPEQMPPEGELTAEQLAEAVPELALSDEQREKLVDYLRESPEELFAEGIEAATPEDRELAEQLLDADMPEGDRGEGQPNEPEELNGGPDTAALEEMLKETGWDEEEIRFVQHNIDILVTVVGPEAAEEATPELHLKIIQLMKKKKEGKEEKDGKDKSDWDAVRDGILALGKIAFRTGKAIFEKLTETDRQNVRNYLASRQEKGTR